MIKRLMPLFLLFAMTALSVLPAPASATSDKELEAQLEKIFRENPDIILDVLRRNKTELFQTVIEGQKENQRQAIIASFTREVNKPKSMRLEDRLVRGNPDAPVTIVAYSDFTCPYCEQAAFTVNTLLANYGDDVRYIFKNKPLEEHEHAMIAAQYFVAAGMQSTEKAWTFYDLVFENRPRLLKEGEPLLKEMAKKAGLDLSRLARDIMSPKVNTIIKEDMEDFDTFGFSGTPYFFVNNIVIRGSVSFDIFSEAVEMALEHAGK